MKLNINTMEQIKKSEGLRLEAYPDPGSKDGKPVTIGYGTTLIDGKPIKLGTKITKAKAEELFVADLERFADQVVKLVNVKLNDNQFGALVSFAYNIGIGAFGKSTLLRKLNSGDYESVPKEMRRWNKNDGKVMQGLINRREDEIKLWLTPSSTTPLESPEKPVDGPKPVRPTGGLIGFIIAVVAAFVAVLFGGAE